MKFTPDNIKELKHNEVFVFGSNIQGEHVGGAALFAHKEFKAMFGNGFGFCDLACKTYAIPTCYRVWLESSNGFCLNSKITKPFESVSQIKPFVNAFISDAKKYKDYTFYVTKIGCGIAGFKVSEVAELFRPCLDMDNVVLPKEFVENLLYPIVIDDLAKRGLVGGKNYNDDIAMRFVMNRIENKLLDDILDEFEDLPEGSPFDD